jgi:DNA polymerase/3'-5' exonuclease PolX
MKQQIPLETAKKLANDVVELLSPHCHRIEIAGSIRRQKEFIGDIEIVAIPKPYQVGLFEDGLAEVVNQWQKVKGELKYGVCKYTQRILPSGISLDLFFAEEDNFGNILLIRTGDWEFSKKFVGVALTKRGYKQEDGFLKHNGKIISCKEEGDLFVKAGIEYILPENRNVNSLIC